MKKAFALILALSLLIALPACGSSPAGYDTPPEPPDLTGEWKQVDGNSEDTWQSATITADYIEVYWVSDNGDTKSLYWAGSFTAPTSADEPYTWESANDTEKTSMALLASTAESKTFTYENGQIVYEVTALGTTTTVRLEKIS